MNAEKRLVRILQEIAERDGWNVYPSDFDPREEAHDEIAKRVLTVPEYEEYCDLVERI